VSDRFDFQNPADLERFELERAAHAVGLRVLLYQIGRFKTVLKRGYADASQKRRYDCYKHLMVAIECLEPTGHGRETIK
jgi:hypothetical protein